jgi:hypothetical protein
MRRRDFLKAVSAVPAVAWLATVRRYQGGGAAAITVETTIFSAADV